MPLCVILSDDMIDGSRIGGHAKALGFDVQIARTPQQAIASLDKNPEALLVDLHLSNLDVTQLVNAVRSHSARARIVAFGAHIDANRLKSARHAGCDEVLPRSAFFEDLDGNLTRWVVPVE